MAKASSKVIGDFSWRIPKVIPSFIEGADAKAIYDQLGERFGQTWYDEKSKVMSGSNTPIAARIDTELRGLGMRVATLADLSRPEVMEMIKGNHYSDTPALILRTVEDSYAPNLEIINGLIPHVEQKQGKLKLPVMITGFDVAPIDNKDGYGWTIVPRDDFNVIEDERLNGKNHGKKFNDVDELGLPKFDNGGSRIWYARNQGISGLGLDRDLDLYSDDEDFASSYDDGRVVVVRGEAADAILSRQYSQKLRQEHEAVKSELDKWYADSISRMPVKSK